MRQLFADLPEAVDNTLAVARRCAWFPEFVSPILPPFATAGGRSEKEELRAQSDAGLQARLEKQVFTPTMDAAAREKAVQPYRERLEFEPGVIPEWGFAGYLRIVPDFIKWGRGPGLPVA